LGFRDGGFFGSDGASHREAKQSGSKGKMRYVWIHAESPSAIWDGVAQIFMDWLYKNTMKWLKTGASGGFCAKRA
jgi:hypothetical protein